LETKFCQIGGFLYFGGHFGFKMATIANQNGRHMEQHVFNPCKYPFPLKSFHFYIGSHFALLIPIFLAYLVPLDVDVTGNITAKICEVWSEFNIFSTLVTMATAAILNLFNPPKAATHYGGYSYKVS
jgi:hypothetical protein